MANHDRRRVQPGRMQPPMAVTLYHWWSSVAREHGGGLMTIADASRLAGVSQTVMKDWLVYTKRPIEPVYRPDHRTPLVPVGQVLDFVDFLTNPEIFPGFLPTNVKPGEEST